MRHELEETDRRIAAALVAAPRASWRAVAHCLGLSERTVVRRAGPLYADGVLRATAVRNPACFPALVPTALRVRCRPNQIRAVAATLARRPDTVWVDVLGGGDEISVVLFLDGPDARNALLLADLPATTAVRSWTAHTLLRVFPTAFAWTAGLLTDAELAALGPNFSTPPATLPVPTEADGPLLDALARNGRISYTELATAVGATPLTARRRLDTLVNGWVVRLATEVDLALLGVHAEALLWLSVEPGRLNQTGMALARHPQVRFVAATTGPTNLLVAVAAADLGALYGFLTETVGELDRISAVETTPIMATAKRTGLLRQG